MVKIGNVEICGPLTLAPMAGVTDAPFRALCRAQGAALTCTEMVSAKALVYHDEKTKQLLWSPPDEHPAAVQIFGHEPEVMAEAAPMALAYSGADILDINMGCPVGKVIRSGDGSALMRDPELAGRIIEAVVKAVDVPVTVKFRKGWDGGNVNAVAFAQMCQQAGAAAIGIVVAILLSNIDYRSLVNVWPVHVVLTWGLVLPTLVIRNVTIGPLTIGYNAGDTDNYSWYKLGGFTFQPTELAKISFILTFAMHLNNVRSRINEPKELAKLLLHLLVPIAIIHVQGDDGTAIIYGIIGCCMMFAAGLSWKYIFAAFAAAGAAVAVAFAFFSDKIGKGYQWYRILAVLDPENTTGWAPSETVWKNIIYQQQRGEIALGSGGIFGNGLFGGRYYSVPNAHNDFILCWIGNAAGFVGCCVVLGVLLAIIIKTFATGACSEDMLGSFICAGIGGAFMAQIFVNVGMNLRLLPVIGVTLPFYSAGGSSVLMLYICVGLVLSVYSHNTKSLFS